MAKVWTENEVLDLMEKKFGDLPLSKAREKAECWVIDHDGILPNENIEATKKAIKEATKGAKTDKPKKERKPKEKDAEKVAFIAKLAEILANEVENVEIANEQKEITFKIGENDYSLSLIKHRPPKD